MSDKNFNENEVLRLGGSVRMCPVCQGPCFSENKGGSVKTGYNPDCVRPLRITLISWWLILTSLFSVFAYYKTRNMPEYRKILMEMQVSEGMALINMVLSAVVNFISGIAMLCRRQWGRSLYLYGSFFLLAMNYFLIKTKVMVIPGFVFLVIIAFVLYRSVARDYFQNREE